MAKDWKRAEMLRKVRLNNISQAAYLAKRGLTDKKAVEAARRISK